MIPKRIFYVWGAKERKRRDVLACMQSWRQICSDYEIIEINEESTEYFDFQKELQNNEWFRTVYQKKMWAYVADYIRIKVLHDNGGIYLDTDVTVLKNFDEFLSDQAFVGIQDNSSDGKFDFVEPAILGAQKSNKLLKYISDIYQKDIWDLPIFTMPELFSWAFKNLYNDQFRTFPAKSQQNTIHCPDINIYPEKIFIPFRYEEEFSPNCITPETHTIHWWGASWVKPEIINFLKNKSKDTNQSVGYFRSIYLFCCIPFMKLFITEDLIKIANFPIIKILRNSEQPKSGYSIIFEVKLFKVIPLIKIKSKRQGEKKKYYLFGIPLLRTIRG